MLPIDRVFDEHKRGLADHGRVLYAIARFRILAEGVSDHALKQISRCVAFGLVRRLMLGG